MISAREFSAICAQLGDQALEDIEWAECCAPPATPEDFANEVGFVICNSGMKNTIARAIWQKVVAARQQGQPASSVFGHAGKSAAIDFAWRERHRLHAEYLAAADKLAFLAGLPWIGEITKFHLARNFGADCCKPDVHLERLAKCHSTTPHALCADLSASTGFRIGTVDVVLWRACANGVLDSRTGAIRGAA